MNSWHSSLPMYLLVLSTLVLTGFCQNKFPTPPEVIFGGFVPMMSEHHIKDEPKLERNSKSLTRYLDATSRLSVEPSFPISIPKKHKFTPSEALGSFPEPRNGKSLFHSRPASHRDSLPQFPLWIPKKHTFGLADAVQTTPGIFPVFSEHAQSNQFPVQAQSNQFSDNAPSEQIIPRNSENHFLENGPSKQVSENFQLDQISDSAPSDQFLAPNILNFFQNINFPVIAHRPNRFKRPPRPNGPPPSQTSVTTFSPVPVRPSQTSSQLQTVPDLQHNEPQKQNPDEALKTFNDGLDNFISNPASFSGRPRPRPVSIPGSNPLLVLPPGLTIEEKTQFLANLDPNQDFIISAPSVNAGVLPLKFQNKQPLILFPPLNRPLNNV